jgi:hypothetical protein
LVCRLVWVSSVGCLLFVVFVCWKESVIVGFIITLFFFFIKMHFTYKFVRRRSFNYSNAFLKVLWQIVNIENGIV